MASPTWPPQADAPLHEQHRQHQQPPRPYDFHPYKMPEHSRAAGSTSPVMFIASGLEPSGSRQPSPAPASRPKRKRITPAQLELLLAVFEKDQSPDYSVRVKCKPP